MNYNITGMDIMILELFAMFDTANVEIKKEKGKKGYFMKQQISCCSSEETQG